jgi:site-specific DNA-methyltransferase (adenine-specific)
MKTPDIAALPVGRLADENCALFVWGIWTKLPDILEVMRAWGFEYRTVGFVWVKTNKRKQAAQAAFFPEDSFDEFFGMGMWTRSNTEVCLIGVRGKVERISNDVRQIIYSPIQEHSRKPDEARERIVRLLGDLPRVELFARRAAAGWDAWGNEVQSAEQASNLMYGI